ncbi:MAG: hypothetical protein KIS76_18785 [Pyrinomonadaceae bacterium]|nr:hypothetical protein [Pyrinomonadaceae bacterium]
MKHWKKIALIFVLALFALQIPFVYKRVKRGQLAQKIARMNAERISSENSEFAEYKGVVHVHSSIGGHSTGRFEEVVPAALKNDLDFVVMTEHASALFNTSAMTLSGVNEGVLYVAGHEFDTENQDRFLIIPGIENAEDMTRESTAETLSIVHSQARLAVVAYPNEFKSWDADFDGIEVVNLNTSTKQISPLWFLPDALWSFSAYPELTLIEHLKRPDKELAKFDAIAAKRRISLHGGNDSHSNIGFHIFGDDSGNSFLKIKPDSYETSFRIFRTHVLLPPSEVLSSDNLIAALVRGNSFIGFDPLSDSDGFSFSASNGDTTAIMGEEIALSPGKTALKIFAPQKALFKIFRSGSQISEVNDTTSFDLPVSEKGVYRVEVYLPALGGPFADFPWIISNPIFIK